MSEHHEQAAVIAWKERNQHSIPELALLFAIANGGKRHVITAAILKAEGVEPGVPDLCLPVRRGNYSGLYLEMKHGKNKSSPHQRAWHDALRTQGFLVVEAGDCHTAINYIRSYLNISAPGRNCVEAAKHLRAAIDKYRSEQKLARLRKRGGKIKKAA